MLFAVIAGPGLEDALEARIKTTCKSYIRINPTPGQWLVAVNAETAKEVSDSLGISADKPDDLGPALVLTVAGYWGREPDNVWEWIVANGG
jgi:hypothetical protein